MKVLNKTLTGKTLKPAVPVNAAVCRWHSAITYMYYALGRTHTHRPAGKEAGVHALAVRLLVQRCTCCCDGMDVELL